MMQASIGLRMTRPLLRGANRRQHRQAEQVLHPGSTLLTMFVSNCHVNAPKGPRGNYDLCRIADHAVEK